MNHFDTLSMPMLFKTFPLLASVLTLKVLCSVTILICLTDKELNHFVWMQKHVQGTYVFVQRCFSDYWEHTSCSNPDFFFVFPSGWASGEPSFTMVRWDWYRAQFGQLHHHILRIQVTRTQQWVLNKLRQGGEKKTQILYVALCPPPRVKPPSPIWHFCTPATVQPCICHHATPA